MGGRTHRLGGLEGPRGQRVPAAAALGAEVRRRRWRVIDEGQDVVVAPLLLRPLHVVVGRGRPTKVSICPQETAVTWIKAGPAVELLSLKHQSIKASETNPPEPRERMRKPEEPGQRDAPPKS